MRVATFNVENLFSRARVLNYRRNDIGDKWLEKIGELQDLMNDEVYTPAKKIKMLALYEEVKEFIEIAENRGKFFKRTSGRKIVGIAPAGKNHWDGNIIFKTEGFVEMARVSTARVVKDLKADILCLVEVENRETLAAFNSQLLKTSPHKFPYNISFDGNDPRGIDLGLLSRYKIRNIQTHIFDKENEQTSRSFVFSRDCLEIELDFKPNKPIYVLLNHFLSKGYTAQERGDERRELQARTVKKILSKYNLSTDRVIVMGDLNDTPASAPLKPLLELPGLTDVLDLQFGPNLTDRWTYFYNNKYDQIDYILVSKPLADAFQSAEIIRKGIFDIERLSNGATKGYDLITNYSDAASDHGAIVAEFNI